MYNICHGPTLLLFQWVGLFDMKSKQEKGFKIDFSCQLSSHLAFLLRRILDRVSHARISLSARCNLMYTGRER